MKRWSVHIYLLAALIGLGSPVFCSISISPVYLVFSFLVGLLLLRIACLRLPAVFSLAFSLGFFSLLQSIDNQIPPALEQINIELTLQVEGLPQNSGQFTRFNARVLDVFSHNLSAGGPSDLVGKKIRLSWRRENVVTGHSSTHGNHSNAQEPLKPGDVWRVIVRLKRPRGLVNPGGFDYQAWLLQQNIAATGYIYSGTEATKLENAKGWDIDSLRYSLAKNLEQALARQNESGTAIGLLLALLVGDKSKINAEQWEVLNKTGTTHLMAISGLHIGLVALFAFLCSRVFLPVIMWQAKPIYLRLVPSLFCFGAACFYALLADFSIPTQRALLFIALLNLIYLVGWKTNVFALLICVAVFIVLNDPFAFMQAGFWLSFVAVACLLWCFSYRTIALRKWKTLIKAQWVVFVGLALPLFMLSLPLSLVSPVANLIAVPIVSFLCIPFLLLGALLGSIGVLETSVLCFRLADKVMQAVWQVLHFFSNYAVTVQHNFDFDIAALVVPMVIMFILTPWRLRIQLPFLVVLLGICLSEPRMEQKISVLDVGQGLAVTVQLKQENAEAYLMLYDAGAKYSDNFDMGSRIVVPYLKHIHAKQLNTIMISHGDNDHAGGVAAVLKTFSTQNFLSGKIEGELVDVQSILKQQQLNHSLCKAGQRWTVGRAEFNVLWPIDETLNITQERNNQSCVVLINVNGFNVLLTGDIEKEAEQYLLNANVLPIHIDVLVAPHHGSKTSSSIAFIQHLSPKHVIFSAGYRNRYHHPSLKIVDRYRKLGSRIWSTAEQGAISIVFTNNQTELNIVAERETNQRLWFD